MVSGALGHQVDLVTAVSRALGRQVGSGTAVSGALGRQVGLVLVARQAGWAGRADQEAGAGLFWRRAGHLEQPWTTS